MALPTEHGGWNFIGEPILLGLLLAPSLGGMALGVAVLGVFLLRQPLKLFIKDVRQQRWVPRTYAARRFIGIYTVLTVAAGLVTIMLASEPAALLPMLFALPLLAVQLVYDFGNQSRSPVAEVAGSAAVGAVASSIVLMQGWPMSLALGLWLALAIKAVTAVLYVRSRLRLERGKPAGVALTLLAHGVACALLVVAQHYGLVPWMALVAISILTGRAALGLSRWRAARPPKIIGMQELVYGLGFVLLIALGYWLA